MKGQKTARAVNPPQTKIVPLEGMEIDWNWRSGRRGIYRARLQELMEAPPGMGIQIDRPSGRTQLIKRAQELGVKLKFGIFEGAIYARIVGAERTAQLYAPKSAPGIIGAPLEGPKDGPLGLTLSALRNGPLTAREVSGLLGCSTPAARETLEKLVARGSVESEDGIYRLVVRKAKE